MSLILITPPAEEPVSLADLKAHLKITDAAEDALIASLGVAARMAVEARYRLALVAQSWRLSLDCAPGAPIALPLSPILSVDSVGAIVGGITEALDPSDYEIDGQRVLIKAPLVTDRALAGIVIAFTAGWGGAASVPSDLQLAVKMTAAHFFENRGDGPLPGAGPAIAALAAPYRSLIL